MSSAEYLSVTETAKLMRAALKKSFPGVKFSVRSESYAGGASINVGWTDGPLQKQVEAIAKNYSGSDFDGMIDLKTSVYRWLLPDGTATFAKTQGTGGSMGIFPARQDLQPSFKARLVRFGADFVFCNRSYSEAFYRRAAERVCSRYGVPVEQIEVGVSAVGSAYLKGAVPNVAGERLDTLVYRELVKRTNYLPASTLAA